MAKLTGVLILAVLTLAGAGLFGIQYAQRTGLNALDEAVEASKVQDEARQAQVNFKIQVQDWKNLLLRGQDPADYKNYVDRFTAQEAQVRAGLVAIRDSAMLSAPLREEMVSILADHEQLGTLYREAIQKFNPSDVETVFASDRSVRGIDQKLTIRIDAVAEQIMADETAEVDRLRREASKRYGTLKTVVSAVALAVLALVAILAWKANRPAMAARA